MKCVHCGCDAFDTKNIRFNSTIRDETIEVIVPAFVCSNCNETLMDSAQMNVLRKASADAYKEHHGLLTSSQISAYRESLGMSQAAFARYLNVGEASIKRWETYYIQDGSQDELIRLKCDAAQAEMNFLAIHWKGSGPDTFNGQRQFSFEVFKNVVLYLVWKIKSSIIYMNKYHFYVDFLHFKNHGVSLTGARYIPLKYGPCPDQYRLMYDTLVSQGYLKKRDEYTYEGVHEPDLSLFDDNEIQTLERVVSIHKKLGKKKVFELSHNEKGYSETKECSFIDYKYAKDIALS